MRSARRRMRPTRSAILRSFPLSRIASRAASTCDRSVSVGDTSPSSAWAAPSASPTSPSTARSMRRTARRRVSGSMAAPFPEAAATCSTMRLARPGSARPVATSFSSVDARICSYSVQFSMASMAAK